MFAEALSDGNKPMCEVAQIGACDEIVESPVRRLLMWPLKAASHCAPLFWQKSPQARAPASLLIYK